MTKLESLHERLEQALGGRIKSITTALGEITLVLGATEYLEACTILRDDADLHFEQCIDVAGVDYSSFGDGVWNGSRFAVVTHLLSVKHNWRVRVRVFCQEDDFPVVPSLTEIWAAAGWYEREAFDLYGIVFEGHTDLRRLLTDYGFIGHPFRKDFPVSGHVEMRYDPEKKRVVYQPVSIEPREVTPRIIREPSYGGVKK